MRAIQFSAPRDAAMPSNLDMPTTAASADSQPRAALSASAAGLHRRAELPTAPTRREDRITAYVEPVVSGIAAGFSGAAPHLPAGSRPARVVATFGNALWSGSGVVREAGNGLGSKTLTLANLLTAAAGGTSAPAAFGASSALGYVSAAAWAGAGGLRITHAIVDNERALVSRALEGASGVMTLGAAGLSAAATKAAASDPVTATALATASPAAWLVSDALQFAAVATSARPRAAAQ